MCETDSKKDTLASSTDGFAVKTQDKSRVYIRQD